MPHTRDCGQRRAGVCGCRTEDDRPIPARTDVNVTHILGAEERGATVDEHPHARLRGMSVAVALTGACDGELGQQGCDLA